MALVLEDLSKSDILSLAEKQDPRIDLEKMSFDQLEVISRYIGNIMSDELSSTDVISKLLRLRTYILLVMWSS